MAMYLHSCGDRERGGHPLPVMSRDVALVGQEREKLLLRSRTKESAVTLGSLYKCCQNLQGTRKLHLSFHFPNVPIPRGHSHEKPKAPWRWQSSFSHIKDSYSIVVGNVSVEALGTEVCVYSPFPDKPLVKRYLKWEHTKKKVAIAAKKAIPKAYHTPSCNIRVNERENPEDVAEE